MGNLHPINSKKDEVIYKEGAIRRVKRDTLTHHAIAYNKVKMKSTKKGNLNTSYNKDEEISLVAQWLRIRLPMQGTQVDHWSRKIPHVVEQLSQCATTTEPAL